MSWKIGEIQPVVVVNSRDPASLPPRETRSMPLAVYKRLWKRFMDSTGGHLKVEYSDGPVYVLNSPESPIWKVCGEVGWIKKDLPIMCMKVEFEYHGDAEDHALYLAHKEGDAK